MPIGAIVAGVGAAGAVGSAAISSNAASSASKTAANTASQNDALEQQLYAQNQAIEAPYIGRGNAAGDEINGLLGLPSGAASAAATPALNGSTTGSMVTGAGKNDQFAGVSEGGITTGAANAILAARPDVQSAYDALSPQTQASFGSPQAYAAYWDNKYQGGNYQPPAVAAPTGSGSGASNTSGNALQTYLNSTDYNFTYNQGLNALQQSQAANGVLSSGGAAKAIQGYGQNQAQSAIGTYLAALQGQQGTGLSSANALAGVGTSTTGAQVANNTSAASTAANAGLYSAGQTSTALNGALNNALTQYTASQTGTSSYTPTGEDAYAQGLL